MKDYSKIKALAQSIIECIGDESEGEDPSLPKQKQEINDGGQDSLYKTDPAADTSLDQGSEEGKKKKKDSAIAMMSTMLKKEFSR